MIKFFSSDFSFLFSIFLLKKIFVRHLSQVGNMFKIKYLINLNEMNEVKDKKFVSIDDCHSEVRSVLAKVVNNQNELPVGITFEEVKRNDLNNPDITEELFDQYRLIVEKVKCMPFFRETVRLMLRDEDSYMAENGNLLNKNFPELAAARRERNAARARKK